MVRLPNSTDATRPPRRTTPAEQPPPARRPIAGVGLTVGTLLLTLFATLLLVLTVPAGADSTGSDDTGSTDAESTDTGSTDGADEGELTDTGEAEADPAAEAEAELLQEGQQVYSQICSSCHQPGGAGLEGQFPPLLGNPNVQDAEYVTEVINNGRQGEIVVDGVTYNGVMPSFSTLSEDEVTSVIAFIQNDFEAPADEAAAGAVGSTGPVAGTELPALTNMGSIVAYLLAAAVIGLVLAPRLTSANSRLDVPWLDAWLKTAVIVLAVAFFVVIVPDWILKRDAVSKLGRFSQDLIGTGMWTLGVVVVLGGLWYAHRESRV